MNGRRVSTSELERRLRDEAPEEPALSRGFRDELSRRLEAEPLGMRIPAPSGSPRWIVPAGVLAAAAAITIAAILLRPSAPTLPPSPTPTPGPAVAQSQATPRDVARALGEAIRASVTQQPQALAVAIERGETPLEQEAKRLLTDARDLAARLSAPVRELGSPAAP